mmetsp:Transcript_63802/g.152152  ORF Transcript_63802/g.152152 Transcript_63802/m.152152 type:complete len:581 (-) Transcript_63802:182-1924(-)|eukprot:CAMPEP_0178412210 /NCGR_PEP_ID=MMETSP0689_2-20121128/21895_1 /TAXON_ID=160604 /ORGANISM="Amphidinium massartii, Strain CS-259" /LENGTH=580 /DNA_ID=CAMNT_0020033445 /DNA_START=74 /DNA_END=1816 /DNA_ORIENTATION=-
MRVDIAPHESQSGSQQDGTYAARTTDFFGAVAFFQRLRSTFGDRFLSFLLLNYLGLKGLMNQLVMAATLPFFQHMQVNATESQLATMVAMIPWSMKGFIGVLSDIVPIGRYHKRGYLLMSSIAGLLGLLALSTLSIAELDEAWVWRMATLFCLVNFMVATYDLLCEGKYSEVMREKGSGSEVLTLVWSCLNFGAFVAALAVGVLLHDALDAQRLIWGCTPLAIALAWRSCAGDLPEEPARSWRSLILKAQSEPGLFLLAFGMVAVTLLTAVATACLGRDARAVIALFSSLALIWAAFKALPATMARSNLYLFMTQVASLDLTGPLSYFYTGQPACVADGPGFSYNYYLSVSNAVGALGAALGAVVFQYMQAWQFRTAFIVTTMIQVVASAFDLVIVTRMNVQMGVSDEAAYLFGDAACQSIAAQMATMPMALLTARLCPRGAEATVFAILAGFQNFGSAVSTVLGSHLADSMGVYAKGLDGPCNFEQLPQLIFFAHMLAPLLCIPFTWCLVPAAAINDETVWMDVSPPPSFRSPAASPPGTPQLQASQTPASFSPEGESGEYVLLQEHEGDGPETFAIFR